MKVPKLKTIDTNNTDEQFHVEQNDLKKKHKKIWKYEKHVVYLYQIIQIEIGHRNQGNTFHVKPTKIN